MGSEPILYPLLLIKMQLQQALEVAEQDVKDASAGVLKELRRFQKEKEGDLKRYMVSCDTIQLLTTATFTDVCCARSPMPNAILTGPRRMPKAGGRRKKRSRRSRCDRIQRRGKVFMNAYNIMNSIADKGVLYLQSVKVFFFFFFLES